MLARSYSSFKVDRTDATYCSRKRHRARVTCKTAEAGIIARPGRAATSAATLISGALDPATPPKASADAARDLSNSRVVIVKEGTHGTGSPCIDGLIAEFVAQGSASALDVSCVEQIHLPPFVTQGQVDQARQKPAAKSSSAMLDPWTPSGDFGAAAGPKSGVPPGFPRGCNAETRSVQNSLALIYSCRGLATSADSGLNSSPNIFSMVAKSSLVRMGFET